MNDRFYLVHDEDSVLWWLCGRSGACQTPGSLARAIELLKRYEKIKANGVTWPVPVWMKSDEYEVARWYGSIGMDGKWAIPLDSTPHRPATSTNRPA